MAAHLVPLSYKSGAIVFRQGEPGSAFYLIANGSVGAYSAGEGAAGETPMNVMRAGEPFGEMALLTNSPRTATTRAETDCEVLRLDRNAFLELVREQPSVALSIAATLSRRLVRLQAQPSEPDAVAADAVWESPSEPLTATADTAAKPQWQPARGVIALAGAVVVLALGWLLPPPAGLTPAAWHALVVLLAALPALALDALMEGTLALLMAGAWVVLGVTTPAIALAGFASTNWVLTVCVLIIGAAIAATGLLYRLALLTISKLRGGFPQEVIAVSVAGLLIAPAVPNGTTRVIIIAPMLKELVEALGHRPQSKAAAGVAMAVLVGFTQMSAAFLTSSTTAVLVAALLPGDTQKDVSWLTWALYGAPANFILFAGLVASILWLYWPGSEERPPADERARSLALQRALLGPMSRNEKIALGAGIGLLIGFTTESLHGVDPAWIAVIATGVMAATRVVTIDTLRAVNWNFALLFGVLISLGTVFGQTGLERWVTDHVAQAVGKLAAIPVVFVVVLALLSIAVSFVVRWQAAAPLITIALAPVASAAGVHPIVVGLTAVIAANGFFLPYQSTSYLALYAGTEGKVFTHAQALPAALAYGAWSIIALALSVPVWRLMGLL